MRSVHALCVNAWQHDQAYVRVFMPASHFRSVYFFVHLQDCKHSTYKGITDRYSAVQQMYRVIGKGGANLVLLDEHNQVHSWRDCCNVFVNDALLGNLHRLLHAGGRGPAVLC